jgi:hypothetical protein
MVSGGFAMDIKLIAKPLAVKTQAKRREILGTSFGKEN